MKYYKEFITELFDKAVPYKLISRNKWHREYMFEIYEVKYECDFYYNEDDDIWALSFSNIDPYTQITNFGKTNYGIEIASIVFTTILKISADFIKETIPRCIKFNADKSWGMGRSSVYEKIAKKFIPNGYELSKIEQHDETTFKITEK